MPPEPPREPLVDSSNHRIDIAAGAQLSTGSISSRAAPLHVGAEVNGFRIEAVLRRDETGFIYRVRPVRGGDQDHELLLRELFIEGLCQRHSGTYSDENSVEVSDPDLPPGAQVYVAEEKASLFGRCLERFVAEASSLAGLGAGIGLVRVLRVFEANATAYQLTEQPIGASLADRIEAIKANRAPRLSDRELTELFANALIGLNRAHNLNVLHRNINPNCIYLCDTGAAELGDFFAAGQVLREQRRDRNKREPTNSLAPAGSPPKRPNTGTTDAANDGRDDERYTPIELVGGRRNQGCWSDLYGLGASLYEALALVAPLPAEERFQKLQCNQLDGYLPLRVVLESVYPSRLLEAIDWMMQTNVRRRPKSATEVAAFLGFELDSNLPRLSRRQFANRGRRLWRRRARSHGDRKPRDFASDVDAKESDWHRIDLSLTAPTPRFGSWPSAVGLLCGTVVCAAVFMQGASGPKSLEGLESQTAVVAAPEESAVPQEENIVREPMAAIDGQDERVGANESAADRASTATPRAALAATPVAATERALEGPRLERYVERHLNAAELAWRDGRLLMPSKGSVLRHLERIIDADPENAAAIAGVNHLLNHFMSELKKAESNGDAVSIRFLNRNIRRVRLRHPASSPKVDARFAALPPPPPPSTRFADVGDIDLRPDFTD